MHGSVFYCVANMPGAVPVTSTRALTNVTLPYLSALADLGWAAAVAADPALGAGLTTHAGELLQRRGRRRRTATRRTPTADDALPNLAPWRQPW